MTILELTIDDIGDQGDGIGHYKGATIFVANTLPQERVRIKLEDSKNMVKRAELLEIIRPGPTRVKPPCPHFPQCGGCRFQHMNDEAYSNYKLGQLQLLFAKERMDTSVFLPAVVTAAGTRRRARLAAKRAAQGALTFGFNEWRSHTVVNVSTCTVLMPELEAFIPTLRDKLTKWLPPNQECDAQITALPDGIDLVLIGGPKLDLDGRQRLGDLAEALGVAHLSWRKWDRSPIEPIAHRSPLTVRYGNTSLAFPPGSFLQATEVGEKALIDFVRDVSGTGVRALDLFCGLGTFGLSLPEAKNVRFADLDGPAIESLERAAKHNPRFQVDLRNLIGDPYSASDCDDFDLVVFDPPRGGAKAQTIQLAKSKVPNIVAISCDPPSFMSDAKTLMEGGYKLKALLPVDQFLWSPHMELAAHFAR